MVRRDGMSVLSWMDQVNKVMSLIAHNLMERMDEAKVEAINDEHEQKVQR